MVSQHRNGVLRRYETTSLPEFSAILLRLSRRTAITDRTLHTRSDRCGEPSRSTRCPRSRTCRVTAMPECGPSTSFAGIRLCSSSSVRALILALELDHVERSKPSGVVLRGSSKTANPASSVAGTSGNLRGMGAPFAARALAALACLRPPPKLPLSQWIERYPVLPEGYFSELSATAGDACGREPPLVCSNFARIRPSNAPTTPV
jgi:hypothetical protein